MYLESPATTRTQQLVARLAPVLAGGNFTEALDFLRRHWTFPQLIDLLSSDVPDARKIAAAALGLVGDKRAVQPLAIALHDRDAMVAQVAEHSLWGVWFRLGICSAACLLKAGSCHLNHSNFDMAVEKFTQAIERDPDFAEAYNQRAIAHYLAERCESAIEDCRAALARMPQHFGAMAGMGHCHAQLGHWQDARHCYRLALAIHPRLEGIQSALHQIDEILKTIPTKTHDSIPGTGAMPIPREQPKTP